MDPAEGLAPAPHPLIDEDMGPLQLTAGDWYHASGRGWVATFPGVPGLDPRTLNGAQVEIDGKPYTVQGVETFAIHDATGKPFGLLVGDR